MPINFPHSPNNNDQFSQAGKTWRWDGTSWVLHSTIAAGIQRTDLSAETASAGTTQLTYNTSTGKFTYTPPDLSGYITTQYTLPTASTTQLGGVKVDGSTVTISNGVISGVSQYTLPTATSTVLGGVKVGTNLSIASGVLSADNQTPTNVTVTDESSDTECYPIFTQSPTGSQAVKSGTNLKFNSASGQIEAGGFKKTGGSGTEFLKADGSIDSTAYITAESDTLATVTARGATTASSMTVQDLIISGNLTVQGTTTTINSATLNIADNKITLNSDLVGSAPSQDCGIVVERGTSTDVEIRWNESADKWQFTNDGSTYTDFSVGSSFPSGGIIMWSGAENAIPSGWVLCNGSNSTPDLRNRFVVGAGTGGSYSVGNNGGSNDATLVSHDHTTNNHTHSFSDSGSFSGDTGYFNTSHTHSHSQNTSENGLHSHRWGTDDNIGAGGGTANPDANGGQAWKAFTDDQGSHVHAVPDTDSGGSNHRHSFSGSVSISGTTGNPSGGGTNTVGSSATGANRPPYYALCFIMKT